MGTVHGLPCRCATSAPGCQTLGTLVCAPPAWAPAAPRHEPTRPARPASQLLLASRPPGPQGGAREAAAEGPRLPSLVRAAAPARGLHADCGRSPCPSLRQAAALVRATATVTFIFLNDGGRKAKAKTA